MSNGRKIPLWIVPLMLTFIGCASIPTSEYPIEMERAFSTAFHEVWDETVGVAKDIGGSIIMEDKPSGLITYKVYDSYTGNSTYVNVYVRRHGDMMSTTVHVVPYTCSVYTGSREIEGNIKLQFEDVSFRKDFSRDASNIFLQRLERRIAAR